MFLYFCAQAVYTVSLEVIRVFYTTDSDFYAWAFGLLTGLTFLTIPWLIWESLRLWNFRLRKLGIMAVAAIGTARIAYLGAGGHLRLAGWIVLLDAATLLWAGFLLGATAAYYEREELLTGLILGVLWIIQSGFKFGWLIGWHTLEWQHMNQWIPATLCIAAFSLVGYIQNGRSTL